MISPRYTLAIFDLDGTILNTLDDLATSVNYALSQHGLTPRTSEQVRQFVGNGIRNLITRSVCAAKGMAVIEGATVSPAFAPAATPSEKDAFFSLVDSVHKNFTAHYKVHCADQTCPYDGIPELLQALRAEGVRTAVVSNKADYGVQELCARYFPGLFDVAIGEREGIKRKPAPDSVLAVLQECGATKEESVYIGDSDVDIQTAKNAELDCISVTWGFRSVDFLRTHGASVIVNSAEEAKEQILKQTNGSFITNDSYITTVSF